MRIIHACMHAHTHTHTHTHTDLPVLLTEESEAVLLGAAILAAKSTEPINSGVRVRPFSCILTCSALNVTKYALSECVI